MWQGSHIAGHFRCDGRWAAGKNSLKSRVRHWRCKAEGLAHCSGSGGRDTSGVAKPEASRRPVMPNANITGSTALPAR